jgi:hypothetical protein
MEYRRGQRLCLQEWVDLAGDNPDKPGSCFVVALRLIYLLVTQIFAWPALASRDSTAKDVEILVLRHHLAVAGAWIHTWPAAGPAIARPPRFGVRVAVSLPTFACRPETRRGICGRVPSRHADADRRGTPAVRVGGGLLRSRSRPRWMAYRPRSRRTVGRRPLTVARRSA